MVPISNGLSVFRQGSNPESVGFGGLSRGDVVGRRLQNLVAGREHGVQLLVRQRAVPLVDLALPPVGRNRVRSFESFRLNVTHVLVN